MTNARLEEYLKAVSKNLGKLPAEERDAVVSEMRSHLHEQVMELRRTDPEMGEIEATERALLRFGDPAEIGVSYGGSGTPVVVNHHTGEVLYRALRATGRVAVATGRGIGKTLKWVFFVVFALLFLALGSALTLLIVFQDDIRETVPRPIHSYSRDLDSEDGNSTASFVVTSNVKEIRVQVSIDRDGTAGCLAMRIRDPNGGIAFDTTDDCEDLRVLLTFYEQGRWTIEYDYTQFNGWVEVDVYAFERAD